MTDDDAPRLCPRHPDRRAAWGLILCSRCVQRMDADLAYLASMWHHLGQLHTGSHAGGTGHPIHPAPPAPLRVDVLDHQQTIAAILSSWVRLVVEDRDLSAQDAPQNAPQQALWLRRHVEWLCGSDFAEDAAAEILEQRTTLAGVIGDTHRGQRIDCVCGWTLRVELADLEAVIVCRGCGFSTTAGMLLRMAVSGEVVEQQPVDADTITHVLGIPRATLDRWAAQGRIRRSHGRFWYSEVVDEAATRRQGRMVAGT